MKKQIISIIDEALERSDQLSQLIKDLKKTMMRKFLQIDKNDDILKIYESGLPTSSWKIVSLKDIVTSDGIDQGPKDELFYEDYFSESGYPLILPKNINSLRFHPHIFRFISNDATTGFQHYMVCGGDIIMLQNGDNAGASALVPFMHENSMLSSGIIRIRLNSNMCEIFYILNILHFYYNTGILKNLPGNESDGITKPIISEMLLPMPPVEKQKEIADSLLQLSGGIVGQENYREEMLKLRKYVEHC